MLLGRARSQLLVVDVQERLMPAMHEGKRMVDKCAVLIQAAGHLGIPITVTEQYRKGLGGTVERLGNLKGDAPVMEKMHFSCAADPRISSRVKSLARRQVVLCGIESHVCVLQSALGFLEMDLDVVIVADAVTSRAQSSVDLALARARAAGASIVDTEMALFEWLHEAGTPEFKELSKLIK